MKIRIITLHRVINNYGSVLQGLALCKFLNNNNYDAEVIDYRPKYDLSLSLKLKNILVKIIFAPYYIIRTRKFIDFIETNNKLTEKKYYNYSSLLKEPPEADVYIAGSDQIWNNFFPCGNDLAYFLKFVKKGKKISYAASLGRDNLSDKELFDIKDRINDFSKILVREESGMVQLKKVGLLEVEHVADPVFLLDKNDYLKMIKNSQGHDKKKYKNYMLVYAVDQDTFLNYTVTKLAERLGLKVISIGGFSKKCKCDKFDRTASPGDFIKLINEAEFVVTSSFHCVAFSLIFNKKFAVVLPKKNPTRIENIVKVCGLSNRIVQDDKTLNDVVNDINYVLPNEKLNIYIQQSKDLLFKAIEN
ncbi:MAG: polysaccharide pyruvyl transferase family protein [Firmicutes bacterium]|nr:polysaccharide pyruvyl transferase family protein [Bacillota bacterium]